MRTNFHGISSVEIGTVDCTQKRLARPLKRVVLGVARWRSTPRGPHSYHMNTDNDVVRHHAIILPQDGEPCY
jgi:hypothetical protein